MTFRFLLCGAALVVAYPVLGSSPGPVTYLVTVNTSTVNGTTGSFDLNFNPGPLMTQSALLDFNGYSGNGTLVGTPTRTGDATGALPALVSFDNGTAFNDYFQQFQYGSTLSFTLTLFGPALSSPDGVSTSGTSLAFSMFSNTAGTTPILTSDTTDGFAFIINVNLDGTTTVTNYSSQTNITVAPVSLQFVPVIPCRIADTRNPTGPFGGPSFTAGSTRSFTIPASTCGIPTTAAAYSLNVTVVPHGPLGYLAEWPTGQSQPVVSTLNSLDGRIKANAAIVPAGTNGAISVYATDATDVVLDINGYFVAPGSATLAFYPVTPCRVVDTRNPTAPLGGPSLAPLTARSFPVLSSTCGIPSTAKAYSLNMTVVPLSSVLGYLSTWPTGATQPLVSTLNSPTGALLANAAIVPAGTGGAIEVFATDSTQVVIDINGYFAPPASGGLSLYSLTPCRVVDTRGATGPLGGPRLAAVTSRSFPVPSSTCAVPTGAKAYSLNVTVVPPGIVGFVTLYGGGSLPLASTLNDSDGSIVANAAIVPAASDGSVSAYTTDATQLILDINGYFGP